MKLFELIDTLWIRFKFFCLITSQYTFFQELYKKSFNGVFRLNYHDMIELIRNNYFAVNKNNRNNRNNNINKKSWDKTKCYYIIDTGTSIFFLGGYCIKKRVFICLSQHQHNIMDTKDKTIEGIKMLINVAQSKGARSIKYSKYKDVKKKRSSLITLGDIKRSYSQ